MRARLFLLCPILFLTACAGGNLSAAEGSLAASQVDLPTVRLGGMLFIGARINGKGPFHLLIDTGSTGLALSAVAAKAAGLKGEIGTVTAVTPAGEFSEPLIRIKRLDSGGMRWENMTALILSPSQLPVVPVMKGIRWDGILGMDAFSNLVLELDFPARQVRVSRSGEAYAGAAPVDCAFQQGNPRVVLEVEGRRVAAVIDSGSGFSLILPDLKRYRLAKPPVLDAGPGGVAVGSTAPGRRRNSQLLGEVRLGPVIWRNPPVREETKGHVANIGVGLLSAWRVVFDPSHDRVYFLDGPPVREWPIF